MADHAVEVIQAFLTDADPFVSGAKQMPVLYKRQKTLDVDRQFGWVTRRSPRHEDKDDKDDKDDDKDDKDESDKRPVRYIRAPILTVTWGEY